MIYAAKATYRDPYFVLYILRLTETHPKNPLRGSRTLSKENWHYEPIEWQMNQLSLRNIQLKFKTSEELQIV